MSEKKSTTGKRTRNFATIVYPDSAPDDWKDILSCQHIPAFISPLHDKDINPTGELKKPHYHVMLLFEGVKTINQAKDIVSLIGGVGCEVINSVRGYARYLCHLDNPEKYQYKEIDVISLCGSDYQGCIGLATDKYKALSEMEDFCDRYNVVSYALLSRYARLHRPDWHRILCDCGSVHMREYVKSVMWSNDTENIHIVDPETGEIIL